MSQPENIEIVVNDQSIAISEGSSVTDVLAVLNIRTKAIAVEINQEIISGQNHATTLVSAGDRLEIVTLVGGG